MCGSKSPRWSVPVLSRLLNAGRSERTGRKTDAPHSCTSPRAGPGDGPSSTLRSHPAPAGSRPASKSSPTDPALRAHPFPAVTAPICRLPILTLFYNSRPFTLETCCGYRYGPTRKSHRLPRIFKGRRKCTGPRGKRGALREQRPYLRPSRFHGVRPLQRKETSSRDFRRRLLVRLRYRTGPRRANLRARVREY